jgi:hypothetical protein
MKARLLPDSIENRLGDLLKEKTKTEKAQFVVFAATLALVLRATLNLFHGINKCQTRC